VYVCLCNSVTESDIRQAAAAGCGGMTELTMRTGCGSTCGSCVADACELLDAARAAVAAPPASGETVVAFPGIQHAA
jgi:bacterioferritin-associated ferredoxin